MNQHIQLVRFIIQHHNGEMFVIEYSSAAGKHTFFEHFQTFRGVPLAKHIIVQANKFATCLIDCVEFLLLSPLCCSVNNHGRDMADRSG